MRTPQELEHLRDQAILLRRQGKSLRQIKEILGPMSNATLHAALKGEPPPEWTRRPQAKDELRARARELRGQGSSYAEIAAALGVAKGSVSLWVRDLPIPARLSYTECRERSAAGARRYWATERPARQARRAVVRAAGVAQIGALTDREILIAGAIAYWCEGAKTKPHRRDDRVSFINGDPDLIRFFLRFLDATGTARTDLRFRIYSHESADVATAQRFWLEIRPLSQDRRMGGVEHGGAPRREPGTGSQAVARRGIGRYRHGIAAGIVGTTLTVMSHNRLYQQSGVE